MKAELEAVKNHLARTPQTPQNRAFLDSVRALVAVAQAKPVKPAKK